MKRVVLCGVTTLLLGACTTATQKVEDEASAESNFTATNHGTGSCEALHEARASLPIASQSICDAVDPFIETTLRECAILWNTAPTSFCGYSTQLDTGCGPTLTGNAAYCPTDDMLMWDRSFIFKRASTNGDFAAVTVLAHEWGHLNQARMGLAPSETRLQISNELHADCHAGVFTAVQELQGHLDPGDAEEAFNSFCQGGDRESPWFNPNGHGTCADRVTAFTTGYNGARANPDAVCSADALAATVQICARY